jgi:hypothetical protein
MRSAPGRTAGIGLDAAAPRSNNLAGANNDNDVPRATVALQSFGERAMTKITTILFLATFCVVGGLAHAADVSGTWTASFDTQVSKQEYTHAEVDGTTLPGPAVEPDRRFDAVGRKIDGNKIVRREAFKAADRVPLLGELAGVDPLARTHRIPAEEFVAALRNA